jgi:hypothetical protein
VVQSDASLDMKSYHDRNESSIAPRYGWDKIIVADGDNGCANLDRASARGIAWRAVLAGGHWNDFVCIDTPGFPDTAKIADYGVLLGFLQTRNVRPWILTPQDGLVSSGHCMAMSGSFYLVYTSSSVSVDLGGLSGTARWEWFDPRTGTTTASGNVNGGATRSFTIPAATDYVLWIAVNGTAGVDEPSYVGATPSRPRRARGAP